MPRCLRRLDRENDGSKDRMPPQRTNALVCFYCSVYVRVSDLRMCGIMHHIRGSVRSLSCEPFVRVSTAYVYPRCAFVYIIHAARGHGIQINYNYMCVCVCVCVCVYTSGTGQYILYLSEFIAPLVM